MNIKEQVNNKSILQYTPVVAWLIIALFPLHKAQAQEVEYVFKKKRDVRSISRFSEGLAAVSTTSGRGFIDTTGSMVIKPQFDDSGDFHDGRAWVAKTDSGTYEETYGFINTEGNLVIPYEFKKVNDFSSDLAAVKKDGQWAYINRQGEEVLDSSYVWKPKYNSASKRYHDKYEPKDFHNGWLMVRRGKEISYVNREGHYLRRDTTFLKATEFSDGIAKVAFSVEKEQKVAGQDTLSKIYRSLPRGRQKEYERALIDTTGKIVAELPDSIKTVQDFHEGLAAYRKPGRYTQTGTWGFINKKGKVVIPAAYKSKPLPFSDGVSYVEVSGEKSDNTDGYAVIIDPTGKVRAKIPFKKGPYTMYDSKLAIHEGLWGVRLHDEKTDQRRWGFMNKEGEIVIPPRFNEITSFHNGRAAVYYITEEGDTVLGAIKNPLKNK